MANTNTRQTNRTPVTLKIKFKSATLVEFIERYAVDISQGGIFIRTKDPLPVGTTLKFEFLLKDSTPLIAGDGTVVWTREHDPKRNGVAPGMGVRFDKISSESQKTLDRVLVGKSGSTSSHVSVQEKSVLDPMDEDDDDNDPAGDFVDSPTRVAPAGLVDSLTQSDFDDEDDDKTPLPKPMPFHSDGGDFDESAFSESTRVVGVDELLANAGREEDNGNNSDLAKVDDLLPSLDGYEDPFGDLNEDSPLASNESVSSDPSVDVTSVTTSAIADDNSDEMQSFLDKVKADKPDEPKKDKKALFPLLSEEEDSSALASDSVNSKPSIATPVPKESEEAGGGMTWIAVAAVILIIGGVGGFWFLNKDKGDNKQAANTETVQSIDAASKIEVVVSTPDAAVLAKTKTVVIAAQPAGAIVSVDGTSLSSAAPATFDLEEGKSFKITVTHNEFLAQTFEVVADGSELESIVLLPKPKRLRISSEPAGASIMLNGVRLKDLTPVEIDLTERHLRRKNLRVQMRLPKYKTYAQAINLSEKEWQHEDSSMVKHFEIALALIPVRTPRTPRTPRIIPDTTTPKDDPPDTTTPKDDPPDTTTPKDDPPDTTTPKDDPPDIATPKDDPPDTTTPKDDTKPKPPDSSPVPPKKDGKEPTPDWMK